jgi:hypothetical protein
MAFVGISDTLVGEVRSVIHSMAQKEVNSLGDCPPIKLIGDESFVTEGLNELWNDAPHLQSQMPHDWCRSWSAIRLILRVKPAPDNLFEVSVDAGLPSTFYGPPKASAAPVASVEAETVDELPEVVQENVRWRMNKKDVEQRWNKVDSDIRKFLRECKSLNEALKLWPDLRVYIPKHFLTRVDTKPERNKSVSSAAAALQNIDTTAAMSAAVIARMA